jgi:hypothetical protein
MNGVHSMVNELGSLMINSYYWRKKNWRENKKLQILKKL